MINLYLSCALVVHNVDDNVLFVVKSLEQQKFYPHLHNQDYILSLPGEKNQVIVDIWGHKTISLEKFTSGS